MRLCSYSGRGEHDSLEIYVFEIVPRGSCGRISQRSRSRKFPDFDLLWRRHNRLRLSHGLGRAGARGRRELSGSVLLPGFWLVTVEFGKSKKPPVRGGVCNHTNSRRINSKLGLGVECKTKIFNQQNSRLG